MEQKENKSALDDQAWFDALIGKTDAGQGARLRRMLYEAELADAAQEDTTHDWQRLQFALRREKNQQENKTGSGLRYFALAASLLIFASAINMLMPTSDLSYQSNAEREGAVMRGVSEQVIFSATPSQEAEQLEGELLRMGVKVHRRSTAEKTTLYISLSHPVKKEVRALLEARTIPLPDQDDLIIVFIPASQ